jgi:uncharacterized damage-inducible protein DinB
MLENRLGDQGKRMSEVPVWYERKFEFSFPVEQFPNICVRMRGAPARLEEMLRAAPQDQRLSKPEGKWSAQEHAGHLLDLESLWMARVDDFLKGGDELTVADLRNRKTDEANYNARPLQSILADFRSSRLRLVDRADKLQPELFSRSMLHPRLKTPMRLVDHLFFVAEHDDHHLAKIWELVRPV